MQLNVWVKMLKLVPHSNKKIVNLRSGAVLNKERKCKILQLWSVVMFTTLLVDFYVQASFEVFKINCENRNKVRGNVLRERERESLCVCVCEKEKEKSVESVMGR